MATNVATDSACGGLCASARCLLFDGGDLGEDAAPGQSLLGIAHNLAELGLQFRSGRQDGPIPGQDDPGPCISRNSIRSRSASAHRVRPIGASSPSCRSWTSSQRRYDSIWDLRARRNLPSFNSTATSRPTDTAGRSAGHAPGDHVTTRREIN